jgi:hypothetical protein
VSFPVDLNERRRRYVDPTADEPPVFPLGHGMTPCDGRRREAGVVDGPRPA